MKRTLLSLIALGAFATSFAGTIVKEILQEPTIWEYNDDTHDRTTNPQCLGDDGTCATEYFLNEDGSLGHQQVTYAQAFVPTRREQALS